MDLQTCSRGSIGSPKNKILPEGAGDAAVFVSLSNDIFAAR
jgi:hypothetical protein